MSYRDAAPPAARPDSPDLTDYEARLRRSSRRKRYVVGGVIGGLAILGMGSCISPVAIELGGSAWRRRKTKLSAPDAAEVKRLLDPIEGQGQRSQAAFAAVWPKLRSGELGARRDLGACSMEVPGPVLHRKDGSVSIHDSAETAGWLFVDVTPPASRSPLANLKMPQGSIALSNSPNGANGGTEERFALPTTALHLFHGDTAPVLDTTAAVGRLPELRAEGATAIPHDRHPNFLQRVRALAEDARALDVLVFVDLWQDPKFSDAPARSKREELEMLARGSRPRLAFSGGVAIARAFAWSARDQRLVCASQALARSSPDITFRSDDLTPLQQDLVLQLEKSLARAFVAVGDAPPRLERPTKNGDL